MDTIVDQQICLRWNNFQSNITAQFGTLRDHEDFVDVTIACGGRRFEAHKVVLSACSPFFKELFKSNPCPHPIIFMRDVEPKHIQALLEFMYAGEVQVAQAHLAGFLRTAESLQIRGLTDASNGHKIENKNHSTNEYETSQQFSSKKHEATSPQQFAKDNSETNRKSNFEEVTQNLFNSSPEPTTIPSNETQINGSHSELQNSTQETRKHPYTEANPSQISSSAAKRPCKDMKSGSVSPSQYVIHPTDLHSELDLATDMIEPKTEPDYGSDDDERTGLDESILGFDDAADIGNAFGGTSGDMEMMSVASNADLSQDSNQGIHSTRTKGSDNLGRHHSLEDSWLPLALDMSGGGVNAATKMVEAAANHAEMLTHLAASNWRTPLTHSALHNHRPKSSGVVKLGEGIEICEEQLRGVKWGDYRKLTRGLATILFSPMELATCSVTGQRWSRAGTGERPVKPALDRAKVQAIISYVATRFPMVEISRIKQVLAYKCKENSTAFKMKAIRFFGDQHIRSPEDLH
ncbi:longitudinals lacking protein, isoforms H/M/V-like isoform X1 [Chrysoperla carnea]|uniref:longitudinals lacking protein, isoforms H/M/V-like isoform X1 n=1 Tax=Chrysoperla carnea TaxID=189513 RepID=UPI001D0740B3|nr:longitudinals lacking protein, isoforms H/M/V-like isoform X1 [Chrysoperla carnea]